MKKFSSLPLLIILCYNLSAEIEFKEMKRFMSLGEKQGYKLTLPVQKVEKFNRVLTDYFKNIEIEAVKPPKGSNELIFRNLKLKGEENSMLLYIVMEQEGKSTGWAGYFFSDRDTANYTNTEKILPFLTSIYNLSMFHVYEDSIFVQEEIIKIAKEKQGIYIKEADLNQRKSSDAKLKIKESEALIELSRTKIENLNIKLPEFEKAKEEARKKLQDAESEKKGVDINKDELDELKGKQKKLKNNLNELKKDPVTNANLILAQEMDLTKLNEILQAKQGEYDKKYSAVKSLLKTAEREMKTTEREHKDIKKKISIEEENIIQITKQILDLRKIIDESEKAADNIINTDKPKADSEFELLNKKLEDLRTAQKAYI